jgi:hypothetical protein
MIYLTNTQFDRLRSLTSKIKDCEIDISDPVNDSDDLNKISKEIEDCCYEVSNILDIAEMKQSLKTGQPLEVV